MTLEGNTKDFKRAMEESRSIARKSVSDIQRATETAMTPMRDFKRKWGNLQVKLGFKTETKEYEQTREQIRKTKEKIEQLAAKQKELMDSGLDTKVTAKYRTLELELARVQREYDRVVEKQKELENSGGAYTQSGQYTMLADSRNNAAAAMMREQSNIAHDKSRLEANPNDPFNDILRHSIQESEEKVKKLQATIDETTTKLKEMEESGTRWIPTQRMEELATEAAEAAQKVDAVKGRMNDLANAGMATELSPEFQTNHAELVSNENTLEGLAEIERQLVANNRMVEANNFSFRKLASTVAGGLTNGFKRVTAAIQKTSGAFAALVKKFSSGISKMVPGLSRITASFRMFNRSASQSGLDVGKLTKSILRYAFGIRSVFALLNKIRTAIKEGLDTMVKADPTGELNASISRLSSTFIQLKNSLAAAVAPLVMALTPALTKLMQVVIKVTDSFAQLMSALTGKPYTKAKEVWQDYAKSLETSAEKSKKAKEAAKKAKEAAKELKRELMGFDQINKLSDDTDKDEDEDEEDEGLKPTDQFGPGVVSKGISDLADKLKAMLGEIKRAWAQEGAAVLASMQKALSAIKTLLSDIAKTFYRVFMEGYGFEWAVSFFQLLRSVFDVVAAIATAFDQAWNDNNRGYDYIVSIFNMFTEINRTLTAIADAFARAWASPSGYNVAAALIYMWTQINNLIAAVAVAFRTAWNNNDNGYWLIRAIMDMWASIYNLIGDVAAAFKTAFLSDSGVRMIESILALIRTVAEIITAITESFRAAWNGGERGVMYAQSIMEMLGAISNLLSSIGQAFKQAWEGGRGQEIIETILAILTNVHETIRNIAESIQRGWEKAGVGVSIFEHILDIVQDVLDFFNEIVKATENWAAELDFYPIFNAFDTLLEKIEPVVKIITTGLAWAWKNILLPLGKWTIEEALPAALEALGAAFDVLTSALEALKPVFEPLWNKVIKPLAEKTGNMIITVLNAIRDALEGLSKFIDEHQEGFRIFTDIVLKLIAAWIAAKAIIGIIGGIIAAAKGIAAVVGVAAAAFNPWIIVVAAVIAAGIALVKNWDKIVNSIKKWRDKVDKALENFFDGLSDQVAKIRTKAIEIGKSVVDGIKKGITDFFSDPLGWLKKNIVDKIVNGIKNLFGIKSPSKVMAEIGGYIIEGMLQGIIDFFKDPLGWIREHIFNPFVDGIKSLFGEGDGSTLWEKGAGLISDLIGGIGSLAGTVADGFIEIKDGIGEKWDDIKKTAGEKWDEISTTLSDAWDGIKSTASTAWDGISSTLSDAWDGISSTASTVWDGISSTVSTAWDGISTTVKDIGNSIGTVSTAAWNGISSAASTAWDGISTTVTNAGNTIATASATVWEGIKGAAGSAWGAITDTVSSAWDAMTVPDDYIVDLNNYADTVNGLSSVVDNLAGSSGVTSDQIFTMQDAVARAWAECQTGSEAMDIFQTACRNAGIGSDVLREACQNTGIDVGNLTSTVSDARTGTTEFGDTTEAVGDNLVEAWRNANSGMTSEINSAVSNAQSQALTLETDMATANQGIESDTSRKWSDIHDAVYDSFQKVHEDLHGSNGLVNKLRDILYERFERMTKVIPTKFKDVAKDIGSYFTKSKSEIEKNFKGSAIVKQMQQVANNVIASFKNVAKDIGSKFTQTQSMIAKALNKTAIVKTASDTAKGFVDSFKSVHTDTAKPFQSIHTEIDKSINKYSITKTATDTAKSFTDAFKNVGSDTGKAFQNVHLDIEKEVRKDEVAGTGKKTASAFTDAFSNISADTASHFESVSTKISEKTDVNSIRSTAENALSAFTNMFVGVSETIKGYFSGVASAMSLDVWSISNNANNAVNAFTAPFANIAYTISGNMYSVLSSIQDVLSYNNLYNIGQNAGNALANGFRNVHIPTPSINITAWDNVQVGNGSMQVPRFAINWYAAGGFPNFGELFLANENGPEMIGRMGNRNVVANNNQIIEGIKQGVLDAFTSAMDKSSSNAQNGDNRPEINVYVGGRKITDVVVEQINQRTRINGISPLLQ